MKRNIVLTFVLPLFLLAGFFSHAQTTPLKVSTQSGMSCTVNGLKAKMLIDERSWYVSLSSATFLFLYENDYLTDSEVIGSGAMKISDGSTERVITVVLKDLEVFGNHYRNQTAYVITKQVVPVLVGRTAIGELPEVEYVTPAQQDSLYLGYKEQAIRHFNNRSYVLACDAFASLYEEGQLDERSMYFYVCALGFSSQYDQFREMSDKWMSLYPDASPDMRRTVAIIRGIAESETGNKEAAKLWNRRAMELYRERGWKDDFVNYINLLVRTAALYNDEDNRAAATYYKAAYEACLEKNHVTEEMISHGLYTDELTATTLYGLGVSYIKDKDTRNGKKYTVLSAKCGNEDAKDICRKMYWRF